MGEPATDDRNDGDLLDDGDDAPWRPDFDGWLADEASDSPPLLDDVPNESEVGPDPAELERWSREHVEREPEPWVPTRPSRPSPPPVVESSANPVVEVAGQPPSATTGELVLGAIVAVALAVGAVAAGLALRPGEVTVVDPAATVVAPAAETRWTIEFDAQVDDVGLGSDTVAIAVDGELVAVDIESGDERWRRPPTASDVDVDRVAVIDGHVFVQQREGGRSELRAYSADTGELQWDTVGDDGVVIISGRDDDALLVRRIQVGGRATVEILEPTTGEPVTDVLRLSGVTAAGDDIAVQPSDRRVAIWSRQAGAVVASTVDEFNLRMVTDVGAGVVALDREGRVILFDDDGRRVDERPFVSDAFGEFTSRPELVGVVDGIGVIASGTTIGFDLADGSIEPVWSREGRAQPPVMTASGPVAVLVGPEPSGQIRETLIDPIDGSTIVVTDPDGKRERSPVLGHNGYVLAPIIGAPTRTLSAFDYDGSELWSMDLPPVATFELAHEVVVVVERDAGGSAVGLAR